MTSRLESQLAYVTAKHEFNTIVGLSCAINRLEP